MHNISIRINSQNADRYYVGLTCIFQEECGLSKRVNIMDLHQGVGLKFHLTTSCTSLVQKQLVRTLWLNTRAKLPVSGWRTMFKETTEHTRENKKGLRSFGLAT